MAILALKVLDKDSNTICVSSGENFVDLVCTHTYEEGDRIVLETDEKNIHVHLQVDDALGDAFVYITDNVSYYVPFGEKRISMSPKVFSGDQADHETARRRHEPSVAVRGVEHHFGADGGCGTGDGGFDGSVTFGDAAEGFGAPVAVVAEFGGDHQPFGFAQRRFFHVVAYIYIGYAQFAEFARDDGVFARDAVQQHQVGLHGGEPLEVEVRVVAHEIGRASCRERVSSPV